MAEEDHIVDRDLHEKIPVNTLARLFEVAAFEHKDTRITEHTVELASEYLKMFVREAIMRANDDRLAPKDTTLHRGESVVQKQLIPDVLNTENLENIAGTLVLDF